MGLLTDARELLKTLAECQMGVYEKLEPTLGRFQGSWNGIHSQRRKTQGPE
jgi:hypothetical protein